MALNLNPWKAFVQVIVQSVQQLAQQVSMVKSQIIAMTHSIGVEDVAPEVRRVGNRIIVGITYVFRSEEAAKAVFEDIKKALGSPSSSSPSSKSHKSRSTPSSSAQTEQNKKLINPEPKQTSSEQGEGQ